MPKIKDIQKNLKRLCINAGYEEKDVNITQEDLI